MTNQLDQLKAFTVVVADTGNFKQMAQYAPRDATTNPSLILKAVQNADYAPLLTDTVAAHQGKPLADIVDQVLVRFGLEILKVVPGRVSTEVDARLSFDTQATIARARGIIKLYEAAGIGRERVLIKIASTWEGIAAARELEADGIHCNLTLLFSFCPGRGLRRRRHHADLAVRRPHLRLVQEDSAGAKWDEAAQAGANDPGRAVGHPHLQLLQEVRHPTEVMGASFRNVGQIQALAGSDLLTISPELLGALQADTGAAGQGAGRRSGQGAVAGPRALRRVRVPLRAQRRRDGHREARRRHPRLRRRFGQARRADRGRVMSLVRCDQTEAWGALRAHYDTSGKAVRPAHRVRGRRERFEPLRGAGAGRVRRPVEEPLGRQHPRAADGPGRRVRPRGAARRDVRRRADQPHRRPRGAAHGAAHAGRMRRR